MEWRAQWRRRSERARVYRHRYTLGEVAAGLDVSVKAVRRWIRNGWLVARRPNHKHGHRYRIRIAAIRRAMQHPMVLSEVGRRLRWRSVSSPSRSHAPRVSPPAKSKGTPAVDTPTDDNEPSNDDAT